MGEEERLDFVYTWVDGAWPGYAELVQQHSTRKLDLNPNRFRDNLDMLKYSLRSLERHAPWLDRLFIVTMRPQAPDWLDPDAPGLELVHHDEIFDPEHLPAFNSLAIVSNLYRIPGVSRRFVYFEDDKLLGSALSREDLIGADGRIRVFERFGFEDNSWRHESSRLSLWRSILARSNHLLNQRHGFHWHGAIHNAPIVIDKEAFAEMVELWPEEVERTRASPFRTFGNIALEHIFPFHLRYRGGAVRVPAGEVLRDTAYASLDNSRLLNRLRLERLRLQRPKFYCLNDNYDECPDPRCVAQVRRFLEEQYPEPSRFERAEAPVRPAR